MLLRCSLLVLCFSGCILADDAIAAVAQEPYLLAKFINAHPRLDLVPLRVALRTDDPAPFAQPCENGNCHAEVEAAGARSDQAIVWIVYKQEHTASWLRYQKDSFSTWRFVSANRAIGKSFDPEHGAIVAADKPFFVVTALGASGAGTLSKVETWYDLSTPGTNAVLTFTKEGTKDEGGKVPGCATCYVKRVKAFATAARIETAKPEAAKPDPAIADGWKLEVARPEAPLQFRVEETVSFETPAFQLGSVTAIAVYTPQSTGPFRVNPALSGVPKATLDSLFEIPLRDDLSGEQFLKLDIVGLRRIAAEHTSPAAQWLAAFLKACKDTPEKKELAGLLQ